MVAGIQDTRGEFRGVHRTYLRDNGSGNALNRAVFSRIARWPASYSSLAFSPPARVFSFRLKTASARLRACSDSTINFVLFGLPG